ncbi:MAG: response regulator transcription factor [Leptospira sp.]|nr:response regulator transcription factor [Leptospira sp.]NCS93284.1 response regulator transcription factor [Leptospira sp.]
MKEAFTISLLEDNEQVINNLISLFDHSSEFNILEIYRETDQAIEGMMSNPPSIALLDIGLPGKDGLYCLDKLRPKLLDTKFVMYTVFEDEEKILHAIRNGANGYLLKDTALDKIIEELKVIQSGGSPLTPRIAARIIYEFNHLLNHFDGKEEENRLSKREKEVLNLVSLGLVYSDIANELDISPHTVSRHVEKIYKKLNVHSKSEAIIMGRRLGIIKNGKLNI